MNNSKTLLIGIIAVLLLFAAVPAYAYQETLYSTTFDNFNGWSGEIASSQWHLASQNACGNGNAAYNNNTDGLQEQINISNLDTRGWQFISVDYNIRTRNLDAGEFLETYYIVNGTSTIIESLTGTVSPCESHSNSLGSDASETPYFGIKFVCKSSANGERCIVDDLTITGTPTRFIWSENPFSLGSVEAGSSTDSTTSVEFSGDHTDTLLSEIEGNGTSFITADTTTISEDDAMDGNTADITWTCAPEIMQAPGTYEAIYNISSTQNTTGENITVECIVDPYSNNEPSVTIDNDSSINVSTSTPIVYVTVSDDSEQPSAYAEIIANDTNASYNVSYGLLQNGVSTPMQFSTLPDGIYSYYARAYDNFSNADNGENLIIFIDATKPVITASPSMHLNQTVTNSTWLANFTVTDNFYLNTVRIEINGTQYTPAQQGNYFTYSANLSLGNSTVNVYANDSLGNLGSMLNGWISYSLPPALAEPQAALPSGGSTKPGLLDLLFGSSQPETTPTPAPQPQPSTTPIPLLTAPINPSPTPAPVPTSGTPPGTGIAPTGAAVATGTEGEVQGDTVTGFVTLLRNVTTITAVLLIGVMLGLLVWINGRRNVSF